MIGQQLLDAGLKLISGANPLFGLGQAIEMVGEIAGSISHHEINGFVARFFSTAVIEW